MNLMPGELITQLANSKVTTAVKAIKGVFLVKVG